MAEYVYEEPAVVTRKVFVDTKGNSHDTRDDAISANVKADAIAHVAAQLARAWPDDSDKRMFVAQALVFQLSKPNGELRQMVELLA